MILDPTLNQVIALNVQCLQTSGLTMPGTVVTAIGTATALIVNLRSKRRVSMFESTKERIAQLERSKDVLMTFTKLDLTWEQRVAIVDSQISISNSIDEYKKFLEQHNVR